MDENKRFELAEFLKELRDKKSDLEAEVKGINAEIDGVQAELIADLIENESTGFNHKGYNFSLVLKEHHSAEPETRDEFYGVLRRAGMDDMFTVNAQTLQGRVSEYKRDHDGELPEWAQGYVKTYEKPSIQIRKGRTV
jgi:hypothetical protein